jgi:hypothetical protein
MEPECSLPCSQEPATGPYPLPGGSSSHPVPLIALLILSFHLLPGVKGGLFPSEFSSISIMKFSRVLHAQCISSSLICWAARITKVGDGENGKSPPPPRQSFAVENLTTQFVKWWLTSRGNQRLTVIYGGPESLPPDGALVLFVFVPCGLRQSRRETDLIFKNRELYGVWVWNRSLTLRKEHRSRVYENRALRKILVPKREEVAGDWRRLHNKELHNLYAS